MTTEPNTEQLQVAEPTVEDQARRVRLVFIGKKPFKVAPADDAVMPEDELDETHPYAPIFEQLLRRADFAEI